MTKKQDLLFMDSSHFSNLYYHNVYSFYDEPVIFTALNDYDQLFFCYSLGCDKKDERWLITPISEKRVNELEQKDIPIVKAISSRRDDYVHLVRCSLETGILDESKVKFSKLPFKLPSEDVFIRENINLDNRRKHTHKIRVSRKSGSEILADYLSDATGAFTNLIKHVLKKHKLKSNFYPIDAVEGSFMYRVKAENKEELREDAYSVFRELSLVDGFLKIIDKNDIDLRRVRKLFDVQIQRDLDIELIDEEYSSSVLQFTSENAKALINEVDKRLLNYLDSSMVPQADRLDEILTYLKILSVDGIVTAEKFKKDKRQVSYYKDACNLLSLVNDFNQLTPFGQKALELDTTSDFVNFIKVQFENSECGYIWMTQQGVRSALELKEETAADFLVNNCNGLSENTANRRSQTLVSWIKLFKQHAVK